MLWASKKLSRFRPGPSFVMSTLDILIPIAIIAVILVGFIVWRSKRDEKRSRGLKDVHTDDPLMGHTPGRVEPDLVNAGSHENAPAAKTTYEEENRPESEGDAFAERIPAPSQEPPIYKVLERQEEDRLRREEEAAKLAAEEVLDRQRPPVNGAIEWVLDISPADGMQFALGGVKSLKLELKRLGLPLLVRVFAQSSKDGLYYEADEFISSARHVVASLLLANRAAQLDEVSASRFFQVLEQSAAQNNVVIHRTLEPRQAVERSAQLHHFIEYFDKKVEILISPRDAEQSFELETVRTAARKAGFTEGSGIWELRFDPMERDPVVTLAFSGDGAHELRLELSLAIANLSRGDLKRFFALANQLAAAMKGNWTDCSHRPVEAGGAMIIAQRAEEHAALMNQSGLVPGSDAARLIFARD